MTSLQIRQIQKPQKKMGEVGDLNESRRKFLKNFVILGTGVLIAPAISIRALAPQDRVISVAVRGIDVVLQPSMNFETITADSTKWTITANGNAARVLIDWQGKKTMPAINDDRLFLPAIYFEKDGYKICAFFCADKDEPNVNEPKSRWYPFPPGNKDIHVGFDRLGSLKENPAAWKSYQEAQKLFEVVRPDYAKIAEAMKPFLEWVLTDEKLKRNAKQEE